MICANPKPSPTFTLGEQHQLLLAKGPLQYQTKTNT